MKKSSFFKHLDFFLLDLLVLAISFILAILIRGDFDQIVIDVYRLLVIFEILSFLAITSIYSPYENILKKSRLSIAYSQLFFSLLQLGAVSIFLFSSQTGYRISRLMIAYEYVLFLLLSLPVKYVWVDRLRDKAKESTKTGDKALLIVTNSKNVKDDLNKIKNNNQEFYRIAGLCILDKKSKGRSYDDYKVVCNKDDLLSYVCVNWIDGVYFDIDYEDIDKELLEGLAKMGVTTHLRLKKVSSLQGQEQTIEKLFNEVTLTSFIKERTSKQIFAKRLIDILGGIVGSLITIILAIFIGPIIKIKSPGGPIFYKQERIGLNGKHFYMYKFRSMIPDADKHLDELKENNIVSSDLMFKMENDPRIIKGIGTFIRKTSIDEFPQFFNVLKGDMSLVGTRPPTVEEWVKYNLEYRVRMSIKPGITGLWQVSGRNSITDFDEVVKLDREYIENWRMGLDIEIIFKTIKVLFTRNNNKAM